MGDFFFPGTSKSENYYLSLPANNGVTAFYIRRQLVIGKSVQSRYCTRSCKLLNPRQYLSPLITMIGKAAGPKENKSENLPLSNKKMPRVKVFNIHDKKLLSPLSFGEGPGVR